jgi:hypothetical protein
MPRDDPAFEAVVDELHQEVLAQVVQLFERYKAQYGQPDRRIKIV